jgi:hypothetical protein
MVTVLNLVLEYLYLFWCSSLTCTVHNYLLVLSVYSLLISGKSFLFTHCPQICVWKEISRPGFLNVSRYTVVRFIDLRRVFLRYVNISIRIFGDGVSVMPGVVWWVVWAESPILVLITIDSTNLKNRMVISRIATSNNHIELLVPGQI